MQAGRLRSQEEHPLAPLKGGIFGAQFGDFFGEESVVVEVDVFNDSGGSIFQADGDFQLFDAL
jgi:hypothetical protein